MKKLFLMAALGFFLSGCGSLSQSEFCKHDTLYKNWDHLKYSWGGYKECKSSDSEKSQDQGWWGIEPQECKAK